MRKLLYIIISACVASMTFNSCDDLTDYLDKAPGVDVTEDTIFSSKTQVETFVIGTYYYTLVSDALAWWDARDKADGTIASATDECEIHPSWFSYQGVWNQAAMNPSSAHQAGDQRFDSCWVAIRRANIIIERIEDAPFDDPSYKKQALGEAQCLLSHILSYSKNMVVFLSLRNASQPPTILEFLVAVLLMLLHSSLRSVIKRFSICLTQTNIRAIREVVPRRQQRWL